MQKRRVQEKVKEMEKRDKGRRKWRKEIFFNARIFKDECFKDNTDNNPSHTLSQVLAHTHRKK